LSNIKNIINIGICKIENLKYFNNISETTCKGGQHQLMLFSPHNPPQLKFFPKYACVGPKTSFGAS
jgi:hypothetical protein